MKQTQQEWYDEQTEKSLLYLLHKDVRLMATVVRVWLILTILGIVLACLFAVMGLMTGTNWFGFDF